jgi:hypothetical protein
MTAGGASGRGAGGPPGACVPSAEEEDDGSGGRPCRESGRWSLLLTAKLVAVGTARNEAGKPLASGTAAGVATVAGRYRLVRATERVLGTNSGIQLRAMLMRDNRIYAVALVVPGNLSQFPTKWIIWEFPDRRGRDLCASREVPMADYANPECFSTATGLSPTSMTRDPDHRGGRRHYRLLKGSHSQRRGLELVQGPP